MAKRTATKRKAAEAAETEMKRAKGETNLFGLQWYEHGEPLAKAVIPLVYLYGDKLPGCGKVAAFDMDSTLINVKSGAKFAKSNIFFDHKKNLFSLKQMLEIGFGGIQSFPRNSLNFIMMVIG